MNTWTATGQVLVHTEAPAHNPANCNSSVNYAVPPEHADIARALLMLAFSAEKPVSLTISGTVCSLDRPMIVAASIFADELASKSGDSLMQPE